MGNSADAEDGPEADFSSGNKDACVLEIDDSEDADILDSLLDPFPPPMVQVFSTEEMMGVATGHVVRRCQTFSQVWRGRIHPSSRDLTFACQRLLASTFRRTWTRRTNFSSLFTGVPSISLT